MSTSVLKRALELFKDSDDINGTCNGDEAKTVKKTKNQKRFKEARKKKSSVSTWQTASDIRRRLQSSDRTDDNLRALMVLSSASVDEHIASKIMARAGGKKLEKTIEVKEEKTVFTEEDFEKFEKEYFVSN